MKVAYNYYMGQCPWDATDPTEPHWRAPTGTVGWVDLASIPQLTGKPGTPRNVGFFACNALLPSEFTLLAQGDCRDIKSTAAMAAAWKALTGVSPDASGTLADMLADHLMHGCDPQGLNTCFPLVPTADRLTEIHLGGHSVVWQRPFVWDNQTHCNRIKAMLQKDLLDCRTDSLAGKRGLKSSDYYFHRRVMQSLIEKYKVTFDDLRPAAWPKAETPLPHQTTITESFNKADSTTLGPDLTWTETTGNLEVFSNTCRAVAISTLSEARAESDLSSADHYAEIIIAGLDTNGTHILSETRSLARFDSSARTHYGTMYSRAAGGNHALFKRVAGSFTSLANISATLNQNDPLRMTCNGSTISSASGGTSLASVTDTAITGNTRCGIATQRDDPATFLDSLTASDLAASTTIYTQLERSIRGINRGMYTHF